MKKTKQTRRVLPPRPDMYSEKSDGYISQTLRFTVDEAKLIREAAAHKSQSINYWVISQLVPIARKQLAKTSK